MGCFASEYAKFAGGRIMHAKEQGRARTRRGGAIRRNKRRQQHQVKWMVTESKNLRMESARRGNTKDTLALTGFWDRMKIDKEESDIATMKKRPSGGS